MLIYESKETFMFYYYVRRIKIVLLKRRKSNMWLKEIKRVQTFRYKINHGDSKYSVGNRVSDTVTTLYDDRGDYTYCGQH